MAKAPELSIGVAQASDLEEVSRAVSWAFGDTPKGAAAWLGSGGIENLRVAKHAGRIVGSLLVIPMGQWFGGCSVPMLGVAGVAVPPEARGQGVALSLMRETLREARANDVALSALYPATLTLYRLAGYELAGARFRFTTRLKDLPTAGRDHDVRPIGEADHRVIEQTYAAWARARTGALDRGEYVWRRVREPREGAARGFCVPGKDGIEGYLYATQRPSPGSCYELVLTDFVALSKRAGRALFGLLADHRSTAETVVWHGGFPEPLFLEQSEVATRVELHEHWMLRIVNVEAALRARGYTSRNAEVELEVDDAELPENTGRYRLVVREGRAEVSRGGKGGARLDARSLAPLYSGFLWASDLARAGRVTGDAASISVLDALFAGPPPGLPDFF
jgi:predicted acetyltransferase